MKLLNRKEPLKTTMAFIEAHRNWDYQNQKYRLSKEEEKRHNKAKLEDCDIYQRGKFLIVEYNNIVHYWERVESRYNFMDDAIYYIDLDRPAKWKTLERLISFREAIRETEVNFCGYVNSILRDEYGNKKRMTFKLFKNFMLLARAHDLLHHGKNTF